MYIYKNYELEHCEIEYMNMQFMKLYEYVNMKLYNLHTIMNTYMNSYMHILYIQLWTRTLWNWIYYAIQNYMNIPIWNYMN